MNMNDSPDKKRDRRVEARTDQILDAAQGLFIEKGFAATTVDEIAGRAKISKGAVYLYFPSKEALLEGLVHRAVSPIAATVVAELDAADASDPRDTLSRVLRRFATAIQNEKTLAVPMLVIREAPNSPGIARTYRDEILARVIPAMAGLLERSQARGAIRPVDPEMTVRTIVGPVLAHLVLAHFFGIVPEGGLQLERMVGNHLDILFDGLSPAGGRA